MLPRAAPAESQRGAKRAGKCAETGKKKPITAHTGSRPGIRYVTTECDDNVVKCCQSTRSQRVVRTHKWGYHAPPTHRARLAANQRRNRATMDQVGVRSSRHGNPSRHRGPTSNQSCSRLLCRSALASAFILTPWPPKASPENTAQGRRRCASEIVRRRLSVRSPKMRGQRHGNATLIHDQLYGKAVKSRLAVCWNDPLRLRHKRSEAQGPGEI
jgi:hypothetical protein